ncbi:BQ2448_8132 [Microbotryum intermedium]|uniref:BQ2448_8132 protein n=1 Tax=Microbotryum intermedium TaxID=269621 RepID=A0A238FQL9_9BASI|nr:BQ2448_8132 [Microbotryum intermedium]
MYTFPPIRKLPRALASSVPHRTLWACRTYLSSEPGSLLTELKRRHSTPSSTTTTPSSPATLFCLSKSVPFSYLSDIHTHLTNQGHTVLGALTESPTSSTPSTQPYSLSLATFTPSSNLTSALRVYPLHSTLLGRPNISLGREHKSSPVDSHDQDQLSEAALGAFLRGEQGWSFGMTNQGSNSSQSHESVDGIEKRLQGLERIDPRNVKQLIYITSDRSTPLLQLLSTTYAKTQKLGLTASSTPFHSPTGEPFTLITPDGQVHSTGAVGLAIVDEANVSTSTRTPTMGKGVQVGYEGLVPFGLGEEKAFEVTSSRGNIVLTLSSQNAARLLLNAVNALQNPSLQKTSTTSTSSSPRPKPWSTSQSQKNQPFYAGVFASKPWNGINLSQASFVCRLMAGDPSRGMMSLDTEKDVRVGDWVVVSLQGVFQKCFEMKRLTG